MDLILPLSEVVTLVTQVFHLAHGCRHRFLQTKPSGPFYNFNWSQKEMLLKFLLWQIWTDGLLNVSCILCKGKKNEILLMVVF